MPHGSKRHGHWLSTVLFLVCRRRRKLLVDARGEVISGMSGIPVFAFVMAVDPFAPVVVAEGRLGVVAIRFARDRFPSRTELCKSNYLDRTRDNHRPAVTALVSS